MKNWKPILQSRYFCFGLLGVVLVVVFFAFLIPRKSKYDLGEEQLRGKVLSYKIDGDLLSFVIDAQEKIQVFYTFSSLEEKVYFENYFGYGTDIIVYGELKVPTSRRIPNTFDYQEYLYYQGIFYICNAKKIDIVKPAKGLNAVRNSITRKLQSWVHSEYMLMMILGNKSDFDPSSVRKNGISHLFAISGMHITLLVAVISRMFMRWGRKKDYIIIGFLFFYAFLVGFTPSVSRAVLCYLLLVLNRRLQLNLDKKQILFYAFLVMLLWNPFYLKDIGFQYSFLISYALLFLEPSKNYFQGILKISVISLVVSLPITAMNFYEINLLAIIWNLFFVPYVSLVLYPMCFLILLFPFLSFLFSVCVEIFEVVNTWCSNITLGVVVIPKLSFALWLLYYGIVMVILHCKQKIGIVLLVLLVLIGKLTPKWDAHGYVYFLDVGQGDSALVISPYQKEVVLIDTGGKIRFSKEDWQTRKENVSLDAFSFLHSLGIKKINMIVISHGDYDHMGEAINFVNNFEVENVIFNCGSFSGLEESFIEVLEKKNISYSSCVKELNYDKYKLQFLNTGVYNNENDNSAVIYFNYYDYKFLFMGDAGTERERDILDKYHLPNIDFLKVGHHGSDTSSSEYFINSIYPKYAFISVGKNNRYGHPKESVLDTLENSTIYRTDVNGTIEIKFDKKGYKIRTCLF